MHTGGMDCFIVGIGHGLAVVTSPKIISSGRIWSKQAEASRPEHLVSTFNVFTDCHRKNVSEFGMTNSMSVNIQCRSTRWAAYQNVCFLTKIALVDSEVIWSISNCRNFQNWPIGPKQWTTQNLWMLSPKGSFHNNGRDILTTFWGMPM